MARLIDRKDIPDPSHPLVGGVWEIESKSMIRGPDGHQKLVIHTDQGLFSGDTVKANVLVLLGSFLQPRLFR